MPIRGVCSRSRGICSPNAVRFTPGGGQVTVTLSARGDEVVLRVADTGCGIPTEFLPHVFERFRQGNSSTTRAHGGLGLGLAIVQDLVALHGGTVQADSPGEGLGATFTVRLPATLHPAPAPRGRRRRHQAAPRG